MAQAFNAALGALTAALFWTGLGLALVRRVLPAPIAASLAWPLAPVLGWAVHSALALPAFRLIGFSTASVLALGVLALAAAAAAAWLTARTEAAPARCPLWIALAAAVIALGPAAAILPKVSADGVALASPIFDHAKVAIIAEMMRLGVPPGNPFLGEAGTAGLAYYYLWHFSAAELALATGISGWEADVAMTWFTVFSSLMLLAGLAAWLAGRAAAAGWALVLAVAGSARPLLHALLDAGTLEKAIRHGTGFGGWYFQTTWSPQNAAGAACVVLALLLLGLSARRREPLLLVVLGLVLAAAFESSTWLGGIVLPLAAGAAGLLLLTRMPAARRIPLLVHWAAAGLLAVAVAVPLILDQLAATAVRGGEAPVVLSPFPVLGDFFGEPWRRLLDLPAFWLVQLPLELPAVYLTGLVALWSIWRAPGGLDGEQRRAVTVLAVLAGVSLAVSSLLASRIGDNNDLGWRAVLPGVMVLTVLAAFGIARWCAAGARLAATVTLAALLLGLPETVAFVHRNIVGTLTPSGRTFARTAAMWAAVRRHSAPDERVANNPLFLADLTPWPVNLSWALLADRRACYAGRELALPFTALSRPRLEEIDARFIRVFAGGATPQDLRDLAERYDCKVVVLTAQDGAWASDPFAANPFYRLVEAEAGRWRIYRAEPAPVTAR